MPTVQPKTANRPAVTPALLEEYCKKFRNWGRWGPEDEIGTLNFITPDVIKRAATLVRKGKVISCALHLGKMYGGRDASLVSSTGAARNGIEHYKDKIVTRGVLLDIARHKGVDALRPGEPIYIEDLESCAASQRVTVEPGDIVLVRTG